MYFDFDQPRRIFRRLARIAGLVMLVVTSAPGRAELLTGAQITSDSVNLSVEAFLNALTSADAQEKEKAGVYLLAISNVGVGKLWCDYNSIQTVTLREFVFEYLKKLPAARHGEPVAPLIEQALHHSFPCRRPK